MKRATKDLIYFVFLSEERSAISAWLTFNLRTHAAGADRDGGPCTISQQDILTPLLDCPWELYREIRSHRNEANRKRYALKLYGREKMRESLSACRRTRRKAKGREEWRGRGTWDEEGRIEDEEVEWRRGIHSDELLLPFIVLAIPAVWIRWFRPIRMPGGVIIKMTSRKRKVKGRGIEKQREIVERVSIADRAFSWIPRDCIINPEKSLISSTPFIFASLFCGVACRRRIDFHIKRVTNRSAVTGPPCQICLSFCPASDVLMFEQLGNRLPIFVHFSE